ncbi:MAG: SEL1-like repeat protein, partial [Thalassobaculaceae bacterium]|nr:SEL1-like repeat protein [Thalassobaculaceae bacterium]
QTRVASAPAGAASTDTKVAPPLPEKAIDVDPRPVAPPPAPHLTRPPAQTSSAAAPSRQGAPPLSRAEAGNPAAQFEVAAGMMRAAVPRPEEAATWFREAAINGLDVAQFNLGVMYEMGLGVPEDETRALLWYHSAAEQGHPLAQYNLGRLYALGKGIPQSDAESKRWFQRAADRGVSAALYAMATFEPGELERERMMYTAAKAGAEEAQAWLREKSSGGTPPAPLGGPAGLVLDPPTGAPDIAAIQEGLAALGYYVGPIDGIAGPVTRAAIGKFQNDNGLPATGLPSRSLRQRLN